MRVFLGRWVRKYKDLEVGIRLACFRNCKEASVAGAGREVDGFGTHFEDGVDGPC